MRQHAQASGNATVSQVGGDQYIVGQHQYIVVQISGSENESQFWEGCPYLGLMPFTTGHAALFFGRRTLLDQLVDRLRSQLSASGPLVVTGPSGAGKSSMLKAGLLPRISEDVLGAGSSQWPRVEMTPTDDPFAELAAQLNLLPGLRNSPVSANALAAGSRQVVAAAHTAIQGASINSRDPEPSPRLLLFVDQAEELFTLAPDATADELSSREAFLTMLSEISTPPAVGAAPVLVVLSVRGDFLDRLLDHLPSPAGQGLENVFRVNRMTEAELRQAVEGPAARVGLSLDDGLVDTVIRELRGAAGTPSFDVGVLPLLSQSMLMTWKAHRERRGAGTLPMTVSDFHDAGGLTGAVEASAEEVFTSLSTDGQAAAEAVLTQLCVVPADGQPARRRVTRQCLARTTNLSLTDVDTVLHQFAARRLMVLDEDSVEISHDALLRAWSRLQGWLQADVADRVLLSSWREDAKAWASNGSDPSYLYRGVQLSDIERAALRWADDRDRYAQPTDVETAFLAAGRLAAVKGVRRRRLVLAGGAAAIAVVLTATTAAINFSSDADSRTARALSLDLAAASLAINAERPVTARRLAAAAWKTDKTDEAKQAMTTLLGQQQHGGILVGHSEAVTALAFSPDGSRLVSGGDDDTIRMWDTATRTAAGAPVAAHGGNVNAVAFSPDGERVASAGDDDKARIWRAPGGTPLGEPIPLPFTGVRVAAPVDADLDQDKRDGIGLVFTEDDQLLTLSEYKVLAWDAATAKPLGEVAPEAGLTQLLSTNGRWLAADGYGPDIALVRTRTGHTIWRPMAGGTKSPEPMAINSEGSRILTGDGLEKTAQLWDTVTGRPVGKRIRGYSSTYDSIFSANGARLATVDVNGTVKVWDAVTGKMIAALPTSGSGTNLMAFSADGRHLAVPDLSGNSVSLWKISASKSSVVRQLTGHNGSVNRLVFSPDGKLLASASNDSTVRLWDVRSAAAATTTLDGNVPGVQQIVFGPGADHIATIDDKKQARLWNRINGRAIPSPLDDIRGADVMKLSPDGTRLAVIRSRNFFEVWDVAAGSRIGGAEIEGLPRVGILQFSPDGRWLAVGPPNALAGTPKAEQSAGMWLWDMTGGTPQGKPLEGDNYISKVLFSPDGRLLAISSGFTVRMWDVHTRKTTGIELSGHHHGLMQMAFSPDGTRIATSSLINNAVAWIWDPITGKRIKELPGHQMTVRHIAFAPDNRTLATVGLDETVRLWNPVDGTPFGVLGGHPGQVGELAYAAGPRLLVVASGNTLSLWDHERTALIEGPNVAHATDLVETVASPDGGTIATSGNDGVIKLWTLSYLTDPYGALCATVGGPSEDELEPYSDGEDVPHACA